MKIRPSATAVVFALASAAEMPPRLMVPVEPYTIDMPNSSKPEASAPSTKYFIAASVAILSSRLSATSAYIDRLNSSRPR